MDSATNLSAPKAIRPEKLAAELAASGDRILALIVSSDEFARVAWHSGRRRARSIERETLSQLCLVAAEFTLPGDCVVHAPGSEYFGIAFVASTRAGMDVLALSAIERVVTARLGIDCVLGWTWIDATDDINVAVRDAGNEARMRRQRRELATLLHDVGTPLSSIHSSLTAVIEGVVDQSTERRFLRTARDECARVGRLVHDFLAVESRDVVVCDFASALLSAVGAVESLARDRGVRMALALDGRAAPVAIDADRAVAVLVALLENAIKHGRAGGMVQAQIRSTDRDCTLTIDDDGPGVSVADRERIFVYGVRSGSNPGSGIGLARARSLLEKRGGRLTVDRSALGGARFTLSIPLFDDATVSV